MKSTHCVLRLSCGVLRLGSELLLASERVRGRLRLLLKLLEERFGPVHLEVPNKQNKRVYGRKCVSKQQNKKQK